MKRIPLSTVVAAVSFAWIGATGYWASTTWPRLPLDLPANDRNVRAAYDNAVHTQISATGLALAPAIALLILAALLRKPHEGPRNDASRAMTSGGMGTSRFSAADAP